MFTDVHPCSLTYTHVRWRTLMFTDIHPCSLMFTDVHSCSLTFTDVHSSSLTFTDVHSHSLMFTNIHWCSLTFTDVHWCILTFTDVCSLMFTDVHSHSLMFTDVHSHTLMYTHVHCLHSCTQICTDTFHYASMKLLLCIFVYTMYTGVHAQHLGIPVLNHASYVECDLRFTLTRIIYHTTNLFKLLTYFLAYVQNPLLTVPRKTKVSVYSLHHSP